MGLFFNYKKNKTWAENISIVMQLGLTMAGCIVCCFLAGRWLDQWLGSRGILTVGLTLFGVVGGAVVAYRQIMEVLPDQHRTDSGNDDENR
ncbi:MAG: AtpZ/AtpI family protein [Desulfosarcina sp.]|nr:AtpZ/AtpI family protein [Desulfobacterales bacterium]